MSDDKSEGITEVGKYRAGGYGAIQTEKTAAADRELAKMSPEDKRRVAELIAQFQSSGANIAGRNIEGPSVTYKGVLDAPNTHPENATRPRDLPAIDPDLSGKGR